MLQWVASIDIVANEEANASVLVKLCESFSDQAAQVGGANGLTSPRLSAHRAYYIACHAAIYFPFTLPK